jgi:hypothetical protein
MLNRYRSRSAVLAAAAVLFSLGTGGFAATAQAAAGPHGRTFYVSPNGSAWYPGTAWAPFKTISQCSAVMVAGDSCVIESGTYHETITPARSGTASAPITYEAAPGAQVVVDGADPVTGWNAVSSADLTSLESGDSFLAGSSFATSVATGQVYQAHVVINPGLTGDQIFFDGQEQVQAQWPYPGTDPSVPTLASAQSGTTDSLSDTALTQPAGFWDGALLTAHNWFVSETGTVTDSQVGSLTAASLPSCVGLSPNQSTNYSLTGKLELLSNPGEWFYQASSHTLYFYSPNGAKPSNGAVEAKQRSVAINLSGRSHISIDNLGIRGATAQTSATSTGDVFTGLVAQDISSDLQLNQDPNMVTTPDGCAVLTAGETTSGILLNGHGNVVQDSLIDGSTGNGVAMLGTDDTVTNTTILHVDELGSYAAGINILGADQTVTHNTVESSGRSDVNIDNKVAGTTAAGDNIAYNDLSDYNNLVVDGGAIYVCCSVNLATSVIDHNQFHDPSPFSASAPAPGVYLDNSTYNATVYDNVAWDRTTYGAVLINPNGSTTSGDQIYNNTSGTDTNVASTFGGTFSTTNIVNNIGVTGTGPGINNTNNFTPVSAVQFTDPAADDFTLSATSPARNAGVVWAPATNGFTDPTPSLGAYQYGAPKWIGGASRVGQLVQAEDYSSTNGVTTHAAGTGTVIGNFNGGDYVGYDNVDFGTDANLFTANVGVVAPYADKGIQIHLDSPTGPLIGTLNVADTGGFDNMALQSTSITPTSGDHDVYLVAPGSQPGFGNVDYFSFNHAGTQVPAAGSPNGALQPLPATSKAGR